MRVEFEPQDIEDIARQVVEAIKPMLLARSEKPDDSIFDVKGLAEYLKVSPSWVYKKTSTAELPHFKHEGLLRFKRSAQ